MKNKYIIVAICGVVIVGLFILLCIWLNSRPLTQTEIIQEEEKMCGDYFYDTSITFDNSNGNKELNIVVANTKLNYSNTDTYCKYSWACVYEIARRSLEYININCTDIFIIFNDTKCAGVAGMGVWYTIDDNIIYYAEYYSVTQETESCTFTPKGFDNKMKKIEQNLLSAGIGESWDA